MKETCGNCFYAETEDGSFLFCPLKDLYTEVGEDDECDETDFHGEKRFTPKETLS